MKLCYVLVFSQGLLYIIEYMLWNYIFVHFIKYLIILLQNCVQLRYVATCAQTQPPIFTLCLSHCRHTRQIMAQNEVSWRDTPLELRAVDRCSYTRKLTRQSWQKYSQPCLRILDSFAWQIIHCIRLLITNYTIFLRDEVQQRRKGPGHGWVITTESVMWMWLLVHNLISLAFS